MTWNPYLVRRRALRFKRGQWKCSCIGGQILPTQNIQQPQKINLHVTRTIHDFSVWNKPLIWSTHVNIVQLAEPISRYMYVHWRMQVFKIEGFVCKHFLSSPPPSPVSSIWLLFFSHMARESGSSGLSLLRTETLATQATQETRSWLFFWVVHVWLLAKVSTNLFQTNKSLPNQRFIHVGASH